MLLRTIHACMCNVSGRVPRLLIYIYIYICRCHHHHTACEPPCPWLDIWYAPVSGWDEILCYVMLCFLLSSLTPVRFFWGIARHVNNKRADSVTTPGAKHRRFENIIPHPHHLMEYVRTSMSSQPSQLSPISYWVSQLVSQTGTRSAHKRIQ